MRKSYIVNVLTLAAIQETVTIRGKVTKTFEGVIHRKNFKVFPFGKVIEKLFALRL